MTQARLIWPTRALLGEGPMWSSQRQALSYVDIHGRAVHHYRPGENSHRTVKLDVRPSFVVPADDGRFVVGAESTLLLMDGDGATSLLATIDMPVHNRTNDATVDRHGRLWFGTMDDGETRSTGAIYCWAEGNLQRMGGDAIVTNGPAISADGSVLYHVDSVSRSIWRCTVIEGAGAMPALGEPELFLRLSADEGYPDGIIVDSEGCLWVALWDGWGVHRYGPDGSLRTRIDLPCQRVTKIAFGGVDLQTGYVTTARVGLAPITLSAQADAGGLFAFDAPAPGIALPAVRLAA